MRFLHLAVALLFASAASAQQVATFQVPAPPIQASAPTASAPSMAAGVKVPVVTWTPTVQMVDLRFRYSAPLRLQGQPLRNLGRKILHGPTRLILVLTPPR